MKLTQRVPVALLMLCLPALLLGGFLAKVTMPEKAKVGDHALVLNSMGIRTKIGFKIYVAGLYLPEKTSDPKVILDTKTPKRFLMHFLYKKVTAKKHAKAWKDGFKDTLPKPTGEMKKEMDTFMEWVNRPMPPGSLIYIDYDPEVGTTVKIMAQEGSKAETMGTLTQKEMSTALFSMFVGPKPAQRSLKKALLNPSK